MSREIFLVGEKVAIYVKEGDRIRDYQGNVEEILADGSIVCFAQAGLGFCVECGCEPDSQGRYPGISFTKNCWVERGWK